MSLELEALSFSRHTHRVLTDITLTLPEGTVGAVIGPNGAGKSSLLHLVARLATPDAGVIRLDGVDLSLLHRRERARRVALVEQQADTDLDLLVSDVVLLGRTPHLPTLGSPGAEDREIARSALEVTGAAAFASRGFQTLSGGERQRVLLARAVAQEPRLLLLDEPTNHLDIRAQLETLALMRTLAETGLTVFAAIHDVNLAIAHADFVFVLHQGRIVAAGPPVETLNPELMQAVYGVTATRVTRPVGPPLLSFDLP